MELVKTTCRGRSKVAPEGRGFPQKLEGFLKKIEGLLKKVEG